MSNLSDIGLIGLGVMGENLALNIERNGYKISIFNRSTDKIDAFVNGSAKGKNVVATYDDKSFVASLARPRKVILLVKAGSPVDQTIDNLLPYLESGDIIIDGGNSHFTDTQKREKALKDKGIYFIGSGVSGGEEGALWGPSLMPGGDKKAYESLKPIWEAIAAKVNDGPCVTYLGSDGAGHFVKMVHNGIEYGDMQLIAEVYDIMRKALKLEADEIAKIFEQWNKGILDSYLIEITAKVLSVKDIDTHKNLVDLIVDKAGQKGTGKWTGESALDLGIPVPTIDAALTARLLSSMKAERTIASKIYNINTKYSVDNKPKLLEALHDALYASKICSYAQGMSLIHQGSLHYQWNIDLAQTARIWKGGCIIRAQLLEKIHNAFSRQNDLPNLMLDPDFSSFLTKAHENWRYAISEAMLAGVPTPALAASLAYFDSYHCQSLPQNLTQAQRDFFGAHTYERIDKPELGFVHTQWNEFIKTEVHK